MAAGPPRAVGLVRGPALGTVDRVGAPAHRAAGRRRRPTRGTGWAVGTDPLGGGPEVRSVIRGKRPAGVGADPPAGGSGPRLTHRPADRGPADPQAAHRQAAHPPDAAARSGSVPGRRRPTRRRGAAACPV
ncbi:hypothetical protein GCM10010286_16990 [Streptomyces toxytricini]|nr:hypothetical protein GCM10010286_16990 [Streptomyces toxytricini]